MEIRIGDRVRVSGIKSPQTEHFIAAFVGKEGVIRSISRVLPKWEYSVVFNERLWENSDTMVFSNNELEVIDV
jgi:hypothetical protein